MPGETLPGAKFPQLVHQAIEVEAQLPLNAELAHFIDCVDSGSEPLVTGEDGLVAVTVSEMVRQKISESLGGG